MSRSHEDLKKKLDRLLKKARNKANQGRIPGVRELYTKMRPIVDQMVFGALVDLRLSQLELEVIAHAQLSVNAIRFHPDSTAHLLQVRTEFERSLTRYAAGRGIDYTKLMELGFEPCPIAQRISQEVWEETQQQVRQYLGVEISNEKYTEE